MSLSWALEIRSVPSSINVILFPFPVVIWCPSFVHVTSLIIALRNFALQANNRLPPGITSASLGSLIVYEQISWLSSDAAWPYDFCLPEKKINFLCQKVFQLTREIDQGKSFINLLQNEVHRLKNCWNLMVGQVRSDNNHWFAVQRPCGQIMKPLKQWR